MSLKSGNTKWVLFLSASADSEDRHILDLAFGLQCLEATGIKQGDIAIYIDGTDRSRIAQWMENGSKNSYIIKTSQDFFVDQASNTHENLVMFVTGHGGISGISAPISITPFALSRAIKKTPNIKNAILYLGQCYAGIFNYIGAGRKVSTDAASDPDLIIMGATNLHESLSLATKENLLNGPVPWMANVFLLHVFKWISNPVDVDGDGKFTVMDSYKYAGAMSNLANKEMKIQNFVTSVELHEKWNVAKHTHTQNPTPITQLQFSAVGQQYANLLNVHHVHQESWILNAIPAQSIQF